jgi:hypothetical protein
MQPKPIILFLAVVTMLGACNNNPTPTIETTVVTDSTTPIVIDPDSVQFSFVFVGCNRVDGKHLGDSNTNASTANLPELQRTFTEVSALNPKPVFFFFLGDEVLGLTQKHKVLEDELKAWKKQYADTLFSPISQSGIQMVAIPGNHEMLYEGYEGKGKKAKKVELPNSIAMKAWLKEMSSFVPDSSIKINRITGTDSLVNAATYSFTYGNTHFIMVNTDTYTTDSVIGMAPAAWINADILTARNDSTVVKHIFILGHKPAIVAEKLYKSEGESIMDVSVVKTIWPVMDSNRVEAMLSAHSHQYNRIQPDSGMAYQIIAGNGGSPYEGALQNPDSIAHQFFGYTIVYVMKNGSVIVQSMGRTVPYQDYLMSLTPADSTTVRDLVNISWGTKAGTYAKRKK